MTKVEDEENANKQEAAAVKRGKNTYAWVGEQLVATTRSGKVYKFEEQIGDVIEKAAKVATIKRKEGNQLVTTLDEVTMYNTLICRSCVEPELDETTFDMNKLKGSETMLLKKVMLELYDLESFM